MDKAKDIQQRDFGPDKFDTIPPHGRWQHFEVGNVPRVADLLEQWKKNGCDDVEITRRLIDLFFVSVLLDAGAGDHWRYVEPGTGKEYERSEGIAVASLYMFNSLAFSSKKMGDVPVVDGKCALVQLFVLWLIQLVLGHGLEQLTTSALAEGFQVSDGNPILGLESRANLLRGLGKSLLAQSEVFGPQGRPGNVVGPYTCSVLVILAHLDDRLHEEDVERRFDT